MIAVDSFNGIEALRCFFRQMSCFINCHHISFFLGYELPKAESACSFQPFGAVTFKMALIQ